MLIYLTEASLSELIRGVTHFTLVGKDTLSVGCNFVKIVRIFSEKATWSKKKD